MGGKAVTPRVLEALESQAGQGMITLGQLVDATGLSESQVQHAITGLRRNNSDLQRTIEVLHRGQCWRYTGPGRNGNGSARDLTSPLVAEPGVGDVLELIGFGENGALVLRDGGGAIYAARRVKL